MSDLRADRKQNSVGDTQDVGWASVHATRTGALFTSSWKEQLLMEGRLFQMTVGTITGGGDLALVTGGGNGTTIDQDQPEFGVSVPNGTSLIPVEITVACQVDMDANGELGNIVVAYDSAAAWAGDGTVTTETAVNMITAGGVSSVASAFSACTADITDPTVSGILAAKTTRGSDNGTAGNLAVVTLELNYAPEVPIIISGPGAFYGYWGGTAAVPGVASVIWAEVPEGRFTVS
jgi:hypothetical protein